MAYRLSSRNAVDDLMYWTQGAASTTYVKGSLAKITNGLPVALSGQTDQPFMFIESLDPQPYNGQSLGMVNGINLSPLRPAVDMVTTVVGEKIGGIQINSSLLFECDVAPLLSRVAAVVNTITSQAICAYAGATGDFTGGIVYLPDQDWQGVVTSSAVAGGNVTLVFSPAAPRACTTNDVVSAITFGVGAAPKFDSVAPSTTLSNAFADKTGGNVMVTKVNFAALTGQTAGSSCVVTQRIKSPI